ncbi:MAG TPA: metallophosphoesterase [Blastocatellia bacterium]|nr:metallophosphoesterase [Blastocatellia bacterium]
MIAQLLNREFLKKSIDQLKKTAAEEAVLQNQGDVEALNRAAELEIDAADLKEAEELLRISAEHEAQRLTQPEDEIAFLPRDAVASLVQSALLEYYETRCTGRIEVSATKRAIAEPIYVTDRQLKGLTMQGEDRRGLFGAFEQTDARWAACLVARGIRWFRGKRRFNPTPAPPLVISNQARIVMVGDWGSGLPRARNVGAAMREVLQEADAAGREQHVIHLGDVYYSGWKREYEKHFLPYWPVKEGEEDRISSWSLNANHDMYSGGQGYYDCLLKDPRFARQSQSSFFSLENDYWHILGLDTGYEEHDLKGDQAEWVKQQAETARGKDLMLMSHHQLFSAYENDGEKLADKLRSVLDAGRVRGWFWGHEHRCACYYPQHKIEYPRLIGHGGVPVWASSAPVPDGVQYEYKGKFDTGLETWAIFGFAVLDFDDWRINVRYINENGVEHHRETLRTSVV